MEIMNENFCHLLSAIIINYLYGRILAASSWMLVTSDIKPGLRGRGR